MGLINRLISVSRETRYRLTEPVMLRWARRAFECYYGPPFSTDPAGVTFVNTNFDERALNEVIRARNSPMVSVIVPTYNRVEILLDRALPSIRAQTYRNLEIIVVCHGCTDDTADRIRGYDPRLRVITIPRKLHYPDTPRNRWLAGPVDPLNVGLREARGDWVARVDDDDQWTVDHVNTLLRFAQDGDFEFVSSGHWQIVADGWALQNVVPYSVHGHTVGGCQTWLYRSYLRFFRYNRDCWRKRWNAVNDTDLQDRMIRAGVKAGYIPQQTAIIEPRPGETEIGLKAYESKRVVG